ncbi:hypothetical protein CALVIDRAFT_458516, partial [Calocera viscosa TUFC12733]
LGGKAMIVGHTWLKLHNPDIDWATGTVVMSRCPLSCGYRAKQLNHNKRIRQ